MESFDIRRTFSTCPETSEIIPDLEKSTCIEFQNARDRKDKATTVDEICLLRSQKLWSHVTDGGLTVYRQFENPTTQNISAIFKIQKKLNKHQANADLIC